METTETTAPTDGPVTITLSKPIDVIGQTVTSITINPPLGRHLMKAGAVMRFTTRDDAGETSVEVNPDAMGKLLGACANLPVRSVEMMSAGDFMACVGVLSGFLAPVATS